tara:strand:- start:107 stop:361 length:255 start_codon:yes stop_codon:yes gene_type:complete
MLNALTNNKNNCEKNNCEKNNCEKNNCEKTIYDKLNEINKVRNSSKYKHDIGYWALVKYCNYDIKILDENIDNIPQYVIDTLEN